MNSLLAFFVPMGALFYISVVSFISIDAISLDNNVLGTQISGPHLDSYQQLLRSQISVCLFLLVLSLTSAIVGIVGYKRSCIRLSERKIVSFVDKPMACLHSKKQSETRPINMLTMSELRSSLAKIFVYFVPIGGLLLISFVLFFNTGSLLIELLFQGQITNGHESYDVYEIINSQINMLSFTSVLSLAVAIIGFVGYTWLLKSINVDRCRLLGRGR